MDSTTKLTDEDLMPFGMYKGTPLEDVPAKYLRFIYDIYTFSPQYMNVKEYIEENLDVIDQQNKNG